MLNNHPTGDYRFLPGIAPYSCGVVARAGFEIVYVTFHNPPPYERGFERIADFLARAGRPKTALCGVSLRSPRPYTFEGFADFNAQYTAILRDWDVFVSGINPIARTNVAPVVHPPTEPVMYGFAFTSPCDPIEPLTFVVAGAGELPEGVLTREGIVARGDNSPAGLAHKARFVMDLMENRLQGLGVTWPSVGVTNVYTAHSLGVLPSSLLLPRLGSAAIHGLRWHLARPPIEEIEYEMDLRGTRRELTLA